VVVAISPAISSPPATDTTTRSDCDYDCDCVIIVIQGCDATAYINGSNFIGGRLHGGCGGERTVMDCLVTHITIGVSEWNRYQ